MTPSPVEQLAFRERARREVLVKSDLIPPLPDVVVRVLALLQNQGTEPRHLEDHLQLDPVLVAKMLGMVNSPFYGLQREVKTIADAVVVLGFRGLRSLLLASGAAHHLQGDFRCYGHEDKGLWKHSLAVASCAKALARASGQEPDRAEQMFVAGLLHDIGKMLLAPYLRDRGAAPAPGDDALAVEARIIGIDHDEAGALVIGKWGLGESIQDTQRHLHDRAAAADPAAVATVRLADDVAHELGIGYAPDAAPRPVLDPGDVQALGLDAGGWEEIRPRMAQAAREALTQLDDLCS